MQHLNEQDRFLFDLQGFLVLRSVLGPEAIARMQRDLELHGVTATTSTNNLFSSFQGFFAWGDDWRGLIDHERILPVLRDIIGEKFRLDHSYGMAMDVASARGGEGLHHQAGMYDHGCYYSTHAGRMHNGLVVVSYALTDVPEGAGGFCCIPGTHKALFPLPSQWFGTLDNPLLRHVPMAAGDVIVFTEALSHGTMPWTVTTHERRAVLLKYAPAYMQWSSSPTAVQDIEPLSPRQRAIVDGPGKMFHRQPVLAPG